MIKSRKIQVLMFQVMKGTNIFLFSYLFLILFLKEISTSAQSKSNGVYIVYMGNSRSLNGALRNDRAQLLSSLIKRNKKAVVQTYSHGFSGFAARLSEEEAKSISKNPGVVSVFPDPVLQLHTTRSWEFLKLETSLKTDSSAPSTPSDSTSSRADSIIGILDTGVWPESDSFIDADMGPIPSRWKGKCMEGLNFTSSNCNRKLIGARYYDDSENGTPRDLTGHGTHVSSTAAGRPVSGASYYGLANGTAVGGSLDSRIAMYRVCDDGGCTGSAILKAFDDAIADGVDVLSLSLGSNSRDPDFTTDPIAIGAFHAVEKGIIVVCSAGNSGPYSETVTNVAPWIMTVAATTIDRDFQANILLGGEKIIKGGGINFNNLNNSSVYPLIDGNSAKLNSSVDANVASTCYPGSLGDAKVKGKIVLCGNDDNIFAPQQKFDALKKQGAIGMILIDNDERQVPSNYGNFPIAAVTKEDGAEILSYIKTESNPLGTISPTVVVQNTKPAPVVGYFSSRGPTPVIRNIIKPDIAAPGVAILAAWPDNDENVAISGLEPPRFNIISGTSMACPHVSGLAATVKSQHPTWSHSATRSAIMTTAIQSSNLQVPVTTETGLGATPYDVGAGVISTSRPLDPGLVYETETIDYIQYLCGIGYDINKIKMIVSTLPTNFTCSKTSNADSISNMNYPSIAVSELKENESKTVKRTATNVGEDESVYSASIEIPSGLNVDVVPSKLQFTKGVKKLTFEVTFKMITASKKDLFGSITWANEKYQVRSPFAVSNA